jgi:hypothetical protein
MPFVYAGNPLTLVGKPTVGTGVYKGECAAIAQFLVPGLGNAHVSQWRRGAAVKGQLSLRPGTVIAIFDSNGRYIGTNKHSHLGGVAHTALYVRQSAVGIEIVHQFKSASCPNIKGAVVRFGGQSVPGHKSGVSSPSGTGTPEDAAENYYVVEL